MKAAEVPCDKVLAAKKKKEELATARAAAEGQRHGKKKRATGEGASTHVVSKNKRVEQSSDNELSSTHISSPAPINRADPVQTLTNAPHHEGNVNPDQLISLHHQSDEFESPLARNTVRQSPAVNPNGDEQVNTALTIPFPSPSPDHSGSFQMVCLP